MQSPDAGARKDVPVSSTIDTFESASGPQKIHKVLAQAGLGSRREMEELIRAGKVKVNGVVALVGMRVQAGDVIRVGRRQVTVRDNTKLPRIILYYKPEGEIVSHDDPQGRPSVFEKLPPMRRGKWLAVGPARLQHQRLADLHDLRGTGQSIDAPSLRGGA